MRIQTKESPLIQAKTPNILDSDQVRYISLGVTIDADLVRTIDAEKIVPIGTAIAKVTSTGLFCPARLTTLSASAASADLVITLANADLFMANDKISINGGAEHTISSINYDTKVATLATAVGADVASAATVKGTGGTGDVVCILYPDRADVTDGDGAFGGIDHARLIRSRLPATHNTLVEAAMTSISFVD